MQKKPPISILTKQERQVIIRDIISFFATEREEEIGIIAAEEVLEMCLDSIGKIVYEKGVDDALTFMKERHAGALIDAEITLKKD